MSLERKLNELGSVIQKGEEAFDLSNERFAQEFSVLPNEHAVAMLLFRKVIFSQKDIEVMGPLGPVKMKMENQS
ncbi:TPA: terminase [Bacillus anthracis]|uniref:hypothetical protein n=1 Tax=Bacillus cereus group TaxID=86661 RepID=UPI0001DBF7C5|nr:hypothetical protein [Bacillus cereus]HDR4496186.1 terminase [Bacillus cereus biovar anthracis]ADK05230.1 phage terminase, putative [Bacillus cereus biovar anthracis str. CI]EJQ94534.1 hypothetical protein IGW_02254 [Bacillus cereus ISP3191]HDR6229005.1 terminase [Bacillus cereus biovar anthracis]HDR6230870.1 terminase [Bacillus cereus biovar anthracis]